MSAERRVTLSEIVMEILTFFSVDSVEDNMSVFFRIFMMMRMNFNMTVAVITCLLSRTLFPVKY